MRLRSQPRTDRGRGLKATLHRAWAGCFRPLPTIMFCSSRESRRTFSDTPASSCGRTEGRGEGEAVVGVTSADVTTWCHEFMKRVLYETGRLVQDEALVDRAWLKKEIDR